MVEFSKENIKMIKSKALESILGLIKENTKETGQMENNMVLGNILLLKRNKVVKKLKRLKMDFGKMGNEFSGLLMKWSNKSNDKL